MIGSVYSRSLQTKECFAGSPLSILEKTYVRRLVERGYSEGTVEAYSKCVAHFSHWLKIRGASLTDISDGLMKYFIDEHLPSCQCAPRCRRSHHEVHAALGHLRAILKTDDLSMSAANASVSSTVVAELDLFDRHLNEVCGLAPCTRSARLRHVRNFLVHSFGPTPIQLSMLGASDVIRFIKQYTVDWVPASISVVTMSLRSYFAFRARHGEHTAMLTAALPRTAQWRLATLPPVLSSEEVEQLISAFDLQHPTGKRDYAIARCLLDLGLRRTEVARLCLDDVDWQAGTLCIRSKGRRIDVMPLPDRTGHAIAQYLLDGRPDTTRRELFVRHRPPINAPADPNIIGHAIGNAARRCGLEHRIRGTHIFRHTLAGRLVKSGARFKEIADLLRHQNLDTTTIYAKVDLNALAQVALPWPRRMS